MAFYVFGGSNSIFSDGWAPTFARMVDKPVHNRSIGATTTLTGIFRFLMTAEDDLPAAGDHVIWEYALNEVTHISYGYRHDMILKNVEHLLVLCRERGCRFIPLIMTPLWQDKAASRDPYYQLLSELFRRYNVTPFDVSVTWRQRYGKRMPDHFYQNSPHYEREPELMAFIASGVADLVAEARVPATVAPHYTKGRSVSLVEGLERGVYQNSLMRIPTIPLPFSTALSGEARISAVLAFCQLDHERGVRIQLRPGSDEQQQMRFSTTNNSAERTIVKAISLEHALGEKWEKLWSFAPQDRLRLSSSFQPGKFYAERELRSTLEAPNPKAPAKIAAILVENEAPQL